MTEALNFREFYQKTPITICTNDRLALEQDRGKGDLVVNYTHWLIALEGNEYTPTTIQWRVIIFPTYSDGHFNCRLPFFQSPYLLSFNEAFELSNRIALLAKQDQLLTIKK